MKCLSIISMAVPMAIFSLGLQAQTGTAPSSTPPASGAVQEGQATGGAQAKPVPAAAVSAELTKRIDTKSAKPGDAVDARTTMAAKLPDGTELPSGTKLTGKVTNVKAKSKEDKSSHLAFNLDRAVLKGGKEVPVMVIVTSVTGPPEGPPTDAMSAGGGGSGVPGGSPGAGGTTSPSGAPAASAPMSTGSSGPSQSSMGGVLKTTQDRVPVGNMPGVMLSATPGTTGTFDSDKDNIALGSGTKLILNVAPGSPPVGQ
jgi:hypothetical protein